MKKLLFTLSLVLFAFVSKAQVPSDDLFIYGFVTNPNATFPIANWPITITGMGQTYTVVTNNDGYYSFNVPSGSLSGPNQLFIVETANCDTTYLTDTVSNNQGTIDSALVNFEICTIPTGECNAQYVAYIDPTVTNHVIFQSQSTSGTLPLTYMWVINGTVVSTLENFDFTFPTNDGMEVCLTITSASGCTDSYCSFVTPGANGTCLPFFTIVPNSTNSSSYSFVNTTTTSAPVQSYYWYFGDGVNSSEANPTHIYTQTGNYSVCLQVTTADCQNTICQTINVVADTSTCHAAFSYSTEISNPTQVYFQNQSSGAALSSIWSINGNVFSDQTFPNFTFPGAGVYEVCLHVVSGTMDPIGCEDTYCQAIVITNDTTNAGCSASYNYTCQAGNLQMVLFDAGLSVIEGNNPTYFWDFGDNSIGSESSLYHTYAVPGIYQVCLTVHSDQCENTFCAYVYAGNQDTTQCNSSFQSVYVGDVPNPQNYPYQFNSAYSGPVDGLNHYWIVSNGLVSDNYHPVFSFTPGTYSICHIVSATNGTCSDTTCMELVVPTDSLPTCEAYFGAEISNTSAMQINFTNMSSTFNAQFTWDFGDGNTATTLNAEHVYAEYGVYTVTLTMTSSNGCSDSYTGTISLDTTNYLYDIGGYIYAGANLADHAKAKLYSIDPISFAAELIATVDADSGFYVFPALPIGTYLVKAGLTDASQYYSQYTPTYFGEQYYWFNAEQIVNNVNGYSYTISLIYGENPGGNGTVGGSIDDGPFRIFNPEYSSAQSPVTGAQVVITNLSDIPQRWIASDNSGNFEITNLAFGTYRLMADQPGMTCVPVEFTISEETPGVNIALVMGEDITGIVSPVSSVLRGDVYPNPSNTIANLLVELPAAGKLSYSLTSITGQMVWSGAESSTAGLRLIQVPVSGFAKGLYMLNVYGQNGQLLGVRKLSIAH